MAGLAELARDHIPGVYGTITAQIDPEGGSRWETRAGQIMGLRYFEGAALTKLYVVNRGSHDVRGRRRGPGSISVLDFATQEVVANWPIPRGGSPDMGNVSADGRFLWLSGRYDNVVYVIDTTMGGVATIPVGTEPHGLTVWPQPGRYSLGHTGNMR